MLQVSLTGLVLAIILPTAWSLLWLAQLPPSPCWGCDIEIDIDSGEQDEVQAVLPHVYAAAANVMDQQLDPKGEDIWHDQETVRFMLTGQCHDVCTTAQAHRIKPRAMLYTLHEPTGCLYRIMPDHTVRTVPFPEHRQ